MTPEIPPGGQTPEAPKTTAAPGEKPRDLVVPSAFLALCIWGFLIWPPASDPFPYFIAIPFTLVGLFYFFRALWSRLGKRGRRNLVAVMAVCLVLLGVVLAGMQIWASYIVGREMPAIEARISAPNSPPIATVMQDATVAMEDGNFYEHHGLDWAALHRALRVNLRSGRIRQGGSTITQQLAKTLFLTEDRTYKRKMLEVPLTWELERRFTKEQILAIYMHSIEYGMEQRGIDNAARYYFNTTPDKLTMAQSLVLVGIVPHNPKQMPNSDRLSQWRDTALSRLSGWFGDKYDRKLRVAARVIPITKLFVVPVPAPLPAPGASLHSPVTPSPAPSLLSALPSPSPTPSSVAK